MIRKKRKNKKNDDGMGTVVRERDGEERLHPGAKKWSFAIVSFMAAAILALSYIGKGGIFGGGLFRLLDFLLGRGYFFAPLVFILVGFSFLFTDRRKFVGVTAFGGALFLLTSLAGFHILFGERAGGAIGTILGSTLISFFDFWASLIMTIGLFAISLLFILNFSLFKTRGKNDDGEEDEADEKDKPIEIKNQTGEPQQNLFEYINSAVRSALESTKPADGDSRNIKDVPVNPASASNVVASSGEETLIAVKRVAKKFGYKKPSLELLRGDRGTPSSGDIRANANVIKRTLENFGIDVEMGEVSIGPTVTQYTLRPAEGVKLSKIVALHSNLSLALASHPIRIEAPIPGKSLVGIEVPNKSIALVGLKTLLENKVFQEATSPLLFSLGRDVTGMPVFADLSKMPHLLVSGATGTGKSVSIHSIMSSFLYRNPPEILRFIIVDPKRVELSVYNDIPHLLTPVITDPKVTIQALRWATKEMDRRYDILSEHHARDIASYNSIIAKSDREELLPYVVIVIDELADLMATFPREVESSIIRLAQMARAVGIHLIVATQRPSVEVLTGLIKANITSRIAFQVASQVDSRTILDMAGAEKLLGNGDMLFVAGDTGKPRRIQGAFVSEPEVKRIVEFLREEVEAPEYDEGILDTKVGEDEFSADSGGDGDDPLYDEAKELILQAGKASASYLQRRLRVGYARAARLLDLMEAQGVIGPADGAKPREVLIKTADLKNDVNFE
jgi:DNA segregation ATPase FtsK/SpoIIIE, S-DNA-T family